MSFSNLFGFIKYLGERLIKEYSQYVWLKAYRADLERMKAEALTAVDETRYVRQYDPKSGKEIEPIHLGDLKDRAGCRPLATCDSADRNRLESEAIQFRKERGELP